jgi:nitrogen fixation/metabolism regulation signal transduction histidine kinase
MRELLHLSSGGTSSSILPVIAATLLALPLILVDMLIISNRFAGPLRRLHKHMQQAAERGDATSVQFRKRDYYPELAQAWNRIVEELNELRQQGAPSRHGEIEDHELAAHGETRNGSNVEELMSAAPS